MLTENLISFRLDLTLLGLVVLILALILLIGAWKKKHENPKWLTAMLTISGLILALGSLFYMLYVLLFGYNS